jgi:hypothetical protein
MVLKGSSKEDSNTKKLMYVAITVVPQVIMQRIVTWVKCVIIANKEDILPVNVPNP